MSIKQKVIKLDNGATLIHSRKSGDPFCSVVIGFGVGKINEDDSNRGISHFIEHMCFNGSKNFSKDDFNDLPPQWAGTMNACTGDFYTKYNIQVLKKYFIKGIELVTDLCFRPTFPKSELEKEKRVVIQEIGECKDDDWMNVWEGFYKCCADERLQHPICGYEDIIEKLTIKDIKNYYNEYYTLDNCTISVCCDVEGWFIKNLFEKILPKRTNKKPIEEEIDHSFRKKHTVKVKKGLTQNKLMKMYTVPNEILNEITIFNQVLGVGLGSRLGKKLRETDGLCYSCGSFVDGYGSDNTLLVMYVSYQDVEKTNYILAQMDYIFKELLTTMTDKEFKRSLNSLKGSLYRGSERSLDICNSALSRYMVGSEINTEEKIKELNSYTKDRVLSSVLKIYLNSDSVNVVLRELK